MKKILNIKASLFFVLLFVLSAGCNDWMDLEPENALTQDEFWNTKDDVMAALGAAYESCRDYTDEMLLYGEVRADFVTTTRHGFNDLAANQISQNSYVASWGGNPDDYWSQGEGFYASINLANTVMHFAPIVAGADQTLSAKILDEIDAEMIFLRSLMYFNLVRLWKEVPIVKTATISDTVEFYIAKSTEEEVLAYIENSLKSVLEKASTDPLSKNRANKFAIQALLADVLLWGERYDECLTYCNEIINSGHFGLESSANWFNNYYPGNSKSESIFEFMFDDYLEGQENPIYGYLGSIGVKRSFYGYDRTNDVRYCKGKGPSWKFTGTDATAKNSRTSGELDVNYIVYRYSEILFMKAECLAEMGDFEEANRLVGQVVERGGVSFTPTYDIKAFRDALLAERGREFAVEGKRWFEVLRFAKRNNWEDKQLIMDILIGKAENAQERAIMRTKVLDPNGYYLPIHINELKANKKLVQNPFYDR